jgi:pilus assembly protein Flp/PilA
LKIWTLSIIKSERKEVKRMKEKIMNFFRDEEGATAVEYGIMVALIAAVIIVAVTAIGTNLETTFDNVATAIGGAGEGASAGAE